MSKQMGYSVALSVVVLAFLAAPARRAHAAIETREILKTFFETGDVPTQDQFSSLIDSALNLVDDRHLIGLKVYDPQLTYLAGDTVIASRLVPGAAVGDLASSSVPQPEFVNAAQLIVDMATYFAGQSGFLGIELQDSTGQVYFGYLQLSMDPTGAPYPSGAGIHVDYLVFDDSPNTPLTVSSVPEPTATAMMSLAVAALTLGRRRTRRTEPTSA